MNPDLFDWTETLERQWPGLVASAASVLLDQGEAMLPSVASASATYPDDYKGAVDAALTRLSDSRKDS